MCFLYNTSLDNRTTPNEERLDRIEHITAGIAEDRRIIQFHQSRCQPNKVPRTDRQTSEPISRDTPRANSPL